MKKYIMLVIVLTFTFTLSGCDYFGPGMADYNYFLSGNYELFHAGATRIWSEKGSGEEVVTPEVTGIAWNDDFILVEQQKVDNDPNYWIIDIKRNKKYEHLNSQEFDVKKSELKIDPNLKLESPYKYIYLDNAQLNNSKK